MKRPFLTALFLIGALLTLPKVNLLPIWKRDFINYWLAGRATWSGVDLYDVEAFQAFALHLFPAALPAQFNFTYPPHSLFLFAPFGALPLEVAFAIWTLLSLALFWWAARPLLPKGFPSILALVTPAGLINVIYGQTGLISAALFLLAFRPNGIAAALLTFKPHLGLLVIPAVARSRTAFAIAVIGTVVLVSASALLWSSSWEQFLDHARDYQGGQLASGSEYAWLVKATTPMIGYGLWGWLLFAAGAAYFLCRNFNVFTAATATFLISPYGFHYDMAAVCLGFAVLLYSRWDALPWWQKAAASLAFMTPCLVDYGTWLVPPILLMGLLVQAEWLKGIRLHVELGHHGRRPHFEMRQVN